MVIGTSKCFGITLTENFNTPFFSCTIPEYWRRWHITLGAWLKDYVLYPVQRSRFIQKTNRFIKSKINKKVAKAVILHLSLFILWFTVGLWYGASWNFIIGTGLLHWSYIVLGEATSPFWEKLIKKLKIKTDCFSYKLFQRIRIFTLVCIGYVFFRATSTKTAIQIFGNMFKSFNSGEVFSRAIFNLGLDAKQLLVLLCAICVLFSIDFMQNRKPVSQRLGEQNAIYRWIIYYALVIAILVFSVVGAGSGQFIYQQF